MLLKKNTMHYLVLSTLIQKNDDAEMKPDDTCWAEIVANHQKKSLFLTNAITSRLSAL